MKILDELKRIANPYPDDDYDDTDELDDFSSETTAKSSRKESKSFESADAFDAAPSQTHGKVVNINTTTKLQVVLVKPDRFDNVADIADHLRERHAVVLNLETASKDVARRLVDFLSGCAYALNGTIKKVAVSTYIITPYNVDIVGDLIDELESSGMYF